MKWLLAAGVLAVGILLGASAPEPPDEYCYIDRTNEIPVLICEETP